MKTHSVEASKFTSNPERVHWHDKALWFVREKRDKASRRIDEWEELRKTASQIKLHTIANLDKYLTEFEANAQANGIIVHWALDANEHNQIVYDILQKKNVKKLVKSKSMLTEECGLNPFLETRGIEVIDTDLGERIVQLRKEHPSHIVLPAIHLKKEEVGQLFEKYLGTEKENSDPTYLTEAARGHLREKFLEADAGLTGVNFAIAETGGFVVCTNEGNADLGNSLPDLHIACMGIEKLIPKVNDLSVFLRLLAASATGQVITTYSSHFMKPKIGQELHIVLVDNGRSNIIGEEEFYRALSCIRCGACINTCPVYRRSGGHSYSYIIPGPIGTVLGPHRGMNEHNSLAFASTLCGSCSDVCPVKINIHEQIFYWRQRIVQSIPQPILKSLSMKLTSYLFQSPTLYKIGTKFAKFALSVLPSSLVKKLVKPWSQHREIPKIANKSFKEMYEEEKK